MKKQKILSLLLALVILFSEFGSFSSLVLGDEPIEEPKIESQDEPVVETLNEPAVKPLSEPIVEEDFIIENGILLGLSDKKKEEIKSTHHVDIPNGVQEIGEHALQGLSLESVTLNEDLKTIKGYAFADNDLTEITLPDSVTNIEEYAFRDNRIKSLNTNKVENIGEGTFQNNKLTSLELTDSLTMIGDAAFKANDLVEVSVPDSVNIIGRNIFIDNNRYVRILGDNSVIETERVDGHYGHVVKSAVITIKYVDKDTNSEIISSKIIGDDLSKDGEIFEIGKEAAYASPKIDGYIASEESVVIKPEKENDTFTVYYIKADKKPVIKTVFKKFKGGDVIDEKALLKDITATDLLGRDISDKITVTPSSFDSSTAGVFDVNYSVTDEFGNTSVVTDKISVGVDWPNIEVGGGLFVRDFTFNEFNGNTVTGFTDEFKKNHTDANGNLTVDELYIPSFNDKGEPVATIGISAFEDFHLTSVTIPNGIKYIRKYAFRKNQITSITIPDSVSTIGEGAFSENQLNAVTIPEGVGSIMYYAFEKNNLTSVDIPNSVYYIGTGAFKLNKLASITIGESVEEIGKYAFYKNQLTSVVIPDSVKKIGYDAFEDNARYRVYAYRRGEGSNVLNNSIKVIYNPYKATGNGEVEWEEDDFSWDGTKLLGFSLKGGEKLKLTNKLTIPKKATKIGIYAFNELNIDSVTIPYGVQGIFAYAFADNKLTSVTIPDSVTSIETYAFYGNRLISVTIPDSVIEIGRNTFRQGYSLIPAYRHGYGTNIVEEWVGVIYNPYKATGDEEFEWNENDFIWNGTVLTGLSDSGAEKIKLTTKINIPNKASKIGNYAFYKVGLTSVVIPDSVISIGSYAFFGNKLTSVIILDSVISIGESAFSDNQLISAMISDNVTSIESDAFRNNQLTSIIIPRNITSIRPGTFTNNKLTSVTIPDSVTSIEEESFKNNQLTSVIIPNSVTSIGKRAFQYNQLTSVTIPNSITKIEEETFENNQLASVTIPSSVTSIGDSAFKNNKITSLTIPDSVKFIGPYAFSYNQLTSVVIPNNVTNIWYYAFKNNQLTSITIPDSVTSIEYSAFENNKLTSVTIPDSVTSIGPSAFKDNQLTSVIIPDSVTSVKGSAFENNQLTSVVIPSSIIKIDNNLFENNKLTSVIIPDSITEIGRDAFKNNPGTPLFNNKVLVTIKDGEKVVNPNDLQDEGNYVINRRIVQVNFVDENREELSSSLFLPAKYSDTELKINLPYVPLMESGSDGTIPLKENEENPIVNIVYKPIDKAKKEEIDKGTELIRFKQYKVPGEEDKNYYIGDAMISYVHMDLSGFSSKLDGYKIRVFFNPNVIDKDKIEIPRSNLVKKIIKGDNYLDLELEELSGGTFIKIPISWRFKKYFTPENTNFDINAIVVDENSKTFAAANTVSFKGWYKKPYLEKSLRGANFSGYVETENLTEDGYLTEDEILTYDFNLKNLDRAVGSYTFTDILPKYINKEGKEVTAVFNPDENPGWELSEDGQTVVYKYTFNNSGVTSMNLPSLKLRAPGLKSYVNIKNNANIEIVPFSKSNTEENMFAEASAVHYFKRLVRVIVPPGESGTNFKKEIFGPHRTNTQAYFYDVKEEKHGEFNWYLYYSWYETDVDKVYIKDYDLDPRMYYSGMTVNNDFVGGKIEAYDKNDETVLIKNIDKEGKIDFEENAARKIKYLVIQKNGINKLSNSGYLKVHSKLRKPDEIAYDETPLSEKNVFYNYASAKYTLKDKSEINFKSADNLALRWLKQRIELEKTTSFSDENHYTDEEGIYTLKVISRSEIISDEMKNFELVDLLPNGLLVNNVQLYQPVEDEPTFSYEIVDNYRDSGQTAIVFKADKLKFLDMGDNKMSIADISVKIDQTMPTGTFTNDAFLYVSNPDFALVNETKDERLEDKIYSKSSVSRYSLRADELVARKYIKRAKDKNWSNTGIITNSNEEFEYKLTVYNFTPLNRDKVQILDVLPFVGDTSMTPNKEKVYISRESEFANKFNYKKQVIVPEGYDVYYLNTPWQGMTDIIDNIDEKLNWESTPSENTSAIKIIARDGVELKANSHLDIIVPMIAPDNSDLKLSGKKAWNAYVRKDNKTIGYSEPNRVYNEMSSPKGTITLTKVGPDKTFKNKIKLSGALFELRDSDGNIVKVSLSNSEGLVVFEDINLLKDYTITEIKAPDGYTKKDTVIKVTSENLLNAENYLYDIGEFSNTRPPEKIQPIVGRIRLNKVDAYDKPLEGVEFTLQGISKWNKDVKIVTVSDENGNVDFADVPAGKYTITESKALNNLIPIEPITVSIKTKDQVISLGPVKNDKVKIDLLKLGVKSFSLQSIYEYKPGNNAKPLGDAIFSLYKGDELIKENITTNSKGIATLSDMDIDTVYRLVETKVPDGYLKLTDEIKFKFDREGKLLTEDGKEFPVANSLCIPNIEKPSINILKLGVLPEKKDKKITDLYAFDGKKLDGVGFSLYNGDTLIRDDLVTANGGQLKLDNLDYNVKYTLKETKPLDDFDVIYPEITIEFKMDGDVIINKNNTISNSRTLCIPNLMKELKSKVVIKKTENKNNTPLANAEFVLNKKVDGSMVEVARKKTNNDGEVIFNDLEYGVYEVFESEAPIGYVKSNMKKTFIVEKYERKEFVYDYPNTPLDFKLKKVTYIAKAVSLDYANKLCAQNSNYMTAVNGKLFDVYMLLPGASFDIIDVENNNIVESVVSDENGNLNINSKLYNQNKVYKVMETKVPDGYEQNMTGWIINLKDLTKQSNFDGVVEMNFDNRPIKGQIIVSKYDKYDETKISGVEYTLYDKDGVALKTLTTDSYGLAKFTNLDLGTYYIEETKALDGYVRNEERVKIEIGKDNLISSKVFYNEPEKTFALPITGKKGALFITSLISMLIAVAFILHKKL